MKEKFRLLLIEDDLVYAKMISTAFDLDDNSHYQIDHAEDLATGMRYLNSRVYQAIISDLNLPDSADMNTISAVLKFAGKIPVIILTSNEDEELGIYAVQAGAQYYLLKQETNKTIIIRSVRHAIARHQSLQSSAQPAADNQFVKVLLVDDQKLVLGIMKRMLHTTPDIHVVGTAENGKDALRLVTELQPDVVCTDLQMPEMDGFELVEKIMKEHPLPILVISHAIQASDSDTVFKLMELGAIDIIPKPIGIKSGEDINSMAKEFVDKIKLVAQSRVERKKKSAPVDRPVKFEAGRVIKPRIIAIGATIGAPRLVHRVLCQLPANFPIPIVCHQVLNETFLQGMRQLLIKECRLKIDFACNNTSPAAGTVYFPPENGQIGFSSQQTFDCAADTVSKQPLNSMFASLARSFGKTGCAILVGDFGHDGPEGLKAVADVGGLVVITSEGTSLNRHVTDLKINPQIIPANNLADWLIDL